MVDKTLLTPLHSKWILYIWDTVENHSLMGHRGSYKTTAITIVGSIWWLLFHPNDRIAIIRKSFTDASLCIKTISKIMKTEEMKLLFVLAHNTIPKTIIDRAETLTFNFKRTQTPEGNIDAYGIDTGITGKHYDKIICDDFVTLKDRTSKAEREKTKNVIREIQTNIIDPGKQVGFIGTPWHKEDCWLIVPEAIKYDINSTNLLSNKEIQKKKKGTTPALFAANYDLKHIANEDALFKDANYDRWLFNTHSKSHTYGHIDAKYSGDHTNGLCFMYRKTNGRIQAIGFCFHENVKDKIDFILKMYKKYYCSIIYLETNADKGFLADRLLKEGCLVNTYHESMNKHVKISTYLYQEWNNIDWDPDSDPEYINQILDYIEGQEPDDCPDNAASLIREKFSVKADSGLYDF